MADYIQCPICGKKIETSEYECLDNGNPACPECVQKELEENN
ncbi:MAG: hypothetical protein ACI4KI_04085 [Candidatus Fimenecus sp.]